MVSGHYISQSSVITQLGVERDKRHSKPVVRAKPLVSVNT